MATIYKLEINTVSPFIAYSDKEIKTIIDNTLKNYRFENTEINSLPTFTNKPITAFAWFPIHTSIGWIWLKKINIV